MFYSRTNIQAWTSQFLLWIAFAWITAAVKVHWFCWISSIGIGNRAKVRNAQINLYILSVYLFTTDILLSAVVRWATCERGTCWWCSVSSRYRSVRCRYALQDDHAGSNFRCLVFFGCSVCSIEFHSDYLFFWSAEWKWQLDGKFLHQTNL